MSRSKPTAPASHLPAPPLPARDAGWALFLDVDGTLLDFVDDPAAVTVQPSLRTLLQQLHQSLGGALSLVSGRTLADLDALFMEPAWAMAGLHGLQLRHADGERIDTAIDTVARARLQRGAEAIVAELGDVQLEDKGAAIALHCRRAPARLKALAEAARALADGLPGYELQAGNLVMEIKPTGMDKGKAVSELLRRPPFTERIPVYVGDDLTDEHGFAAAARAGGFGIRVGDRTPTSGLFTLPGPAAVHAWLLRVHHALAQGDPPYGPFPGEGTAESS